MPNRKRIVLALFIIFLSIACDRGAKEVARGSLPHARDLSFAGDMLRLDYNLNTGAVFSFE